MSTGDALFVFFTAVYAIRQISRVANAVETISIELTRLRAIAEANRR